MQAKQMSKDEMQLELEEISAYWTTAGVPIKGPEGEYSWLGRMGRWAKSFYRPKPNAPTYDELRKENERLNTEVHKLRDRLEIAPTY